MLATAPGWIRDVGVTAAALAAVLTCLGILGRWVTGLLRKELAAQLAPVHRRIDDHMHEEETTLSDVRDALQVLARHVGVELPPIRE